MSMESIYKVIDEIRLGVLPPENIRRISVAEIQTADTYDEDGVPITSGLMDGRLGTLEPRQRCKTCGNTSVQCPGHFGHIELAVPIVHIGFAKIIYDIIRATCRNCGRILLDANQIVQMKAKIQHSSDLMGDAQDQLYKKVLNQAKKAKKCFYCGSPQYKITFSKPTDFHETTEYGAQRLMPSMIRERLERMNNDDLKLVGLNPEISRPEWMILQVLLVPPLYVRPSITLESGIRSEDDLTHKLVDIIRINQRLKENMEAGAPTLIIQDLSELLQYHVTTYFNNEASGIPPARHRSGRVLRTLSQRLKGKEGRFRSNLSGKRVDFSARTVISPDPNLDINEVGVPHDVAIRLSVPEKVTIWNIDELKKFVINGPEIYPGALYVVRPDGRRVRLEFVIDRKVVAEALEPGFIVERHLKDGDVAIFNRQPSLHRMSIMSHFVRVLPYKTFRLHLCVCPPYNADFDGDEMNLHIPQSEESQTEARLLMQVQDQILSPRFGGPIMGALRDFITAAYLFTQRSTLLTKNEVCTLLMGVSYEGDLPEPITKEPQPLWTGKQIFSLFLPNDLNYVLRANICQNCSHCLREECPNDAYVVVKNGILECGIIDRNSIGAERSETLLHRVIKDYGTNSGRQFLNSICKIFKIFMTQRGFTYSFSELELSRLVKDEINRAIGDSEGRIRELIKSYQEGRLPRLAGQSLSESFEIYVMNELAEARDKAGNIADKEFDINNSGVLMTRTGARGSSLNLGQMSACVGQQSVRGKRIMRGYVNRALPHFKLGDPSPKARGFVYSCYRDGLDPVEFFFHAMGGREGLVDTAVRTQQSGYMQRRLINALEHLRIEYDRTVRNSIGNIIQFRYGEDGVDPAKSDHGKAVNVRRLIEQVGIMVEKGKPAPKRYITESLKEVETQLTPLLVKELKNELVKANLTKDGVDKAVNLTLDNYKRALVEPGEAVGVIAAQSIGEPGTQMTLRTFHYAGVREQNVTLGLPRLIEIVDARRDPSTPIMSIYLDKEYRKKREKATEVARKIICTTFEDVTQLMYINHETDEIVVELNTSMVEERGLAVDDLVKAMPQKYNVTAIENKFVIKPEKPTDVKKIFDKIFKINIKGAPGVRRVLIIEEKGEWILRTEGSNLQMVLEVPGVDYARTVTNHIQEIARTLGIEAARNAIIHEAVGVLEEQGLDVDIRHVMLVSDIMTSNSEVQQIGRHGVSGKKSSVLGRAAFEISVANILEAAVKGESDKLRGVTENVIVGQTIPIGTGLVDLYMSGHSE